MLDLRVDEPTSEIHTEHHSPLAHLLERQILPMLATPRVMPSAIPIHPWMFGRPGNPA